MQYELVIISTNNIRFDREQVHFYILYMLSSLQCSVREKSERKIIVLEGSCARHSIASGVNRTKIPTSRKSK